MTLSNSPFLNFKTNRIFKEFYLSHAKTTLSIPIVYRSLVKQRCRALSYRSNLIFFGEK